MTSLRGRLLAFLLTLAAVSAVSLAFVTYRGVLRETDELFDYQLRQMALSLRDQGAISAEESAALGDPTFDYVVQIWAPDGTVTYSSRVSPGLPQRAVLGFDDVEIEGRKWRVFSTTARGRVIQVGQPLAVREELAAAAAGRSVLPLLVVAPVVAAAVWWLVGLSLTPLRQLVSAVRARDAESLVPLEVAREPSEVAPLVDALNALLEKLHDAFDAQRSFIADAAHELRSPLTAVKLQLELVARATDESARAQALKELTAGIERLRNLVEQLLTLARVEPGGAEVAFADTDLVEIARQATADTVSLAALREVELEFDGSQAIVVRGDAVALRILARNLIDNAVRYAGRKGRVHVQLKQEDAVALLRVDDSGPGIPPEDRMRVFDRFYRRRDSDMTGSGLGLAIVQVIAKRHDAQVSLENSPLGGLRIEVRLPLAGSREVADLKTMTSGKGAETAGVRGTGNTARR
ncbi:MAG TPA: ATP-binding protein [Burkholderiaceae bacterium]|nr:ATP-binding protein [Burkholderiaceae bacterium]